MSRRTAIIVGAGPAGLTAAYELLQRTDIQPVVLERDDFLGGIARTVQYKGNRMDIGGHRFFSKSDRVMKWWFNILPLAAGPRTITIAYQHHTQEVSEPPMVDPARTDNVMLLRLSDHPLRQYAPEPRRRAHGQDRNQLRARARLSGPE